MATAVSKETYWHLVNRKPRERPWRGEQAYRRDRDTAIVRAYLEALEAKASQPRREDPGPLREEIAEVEERIQLEHGVDRLLLIQRRIDLETHLAELTDSSPTLTLSEAEAQFVPIIKKWAGSYGISYSVLLSQGVPASVLQSAGMSPSGSRVAGART